MSNNISFSEDLGALRDRSLLRTLRTLPASGAKFRHEGKEYLNFSSNDYLDLANNSQVKAAAARALEEYGVGATSSRLMSGHLPVHVETELALASLCGQECALLFASGYQCNVGVLTSLGREGDVIFSDALNHASIIDGCRLSRAEVKVFPHTDLESLEKLLQTGVGYRRRIIVSDAVFSMDGDVADVAALRSLADRYDAILVVDEAHAIGVMGKGGGLCAEQGVRADVIIGTLSKALGSQGGFAACSETIRDCIVNHARSFIYSTGLAPVCAAAAKEAVQIIHEQPHQGKELCAHASRMSVALRAWGFSVPDTLAPIIPVQVGDDALVMKYAKELFEVGIIAVGIRPPTVPPGTARLRLTLTTAHNDADIALGVSRIAECVLGVAHAR